ncbi:hypothetical protein B0T20DRAFT_478713 [Sordaria brevicollis]|uniref:Uncharacterized protein n=1 Tax=Sordaria brevicollis TaxID=83679 RepID=A0AAE0UCS9_SORBR|nr:hypothetical protein B0T20DRAFT_478713 [Sordaria brevicollis]
MSSLNRPTSNSRRSRPTRPPPTLRREDAMVEYNNVNDIVNRAAQVLQLGSQGRVRILVNNQRITHEPQLPAYTQNAGSNEITMDSTPGEPLPTYEQVTRMDAQGPAKIMPGEAPPPYSP